ncbi:hypothetical protein [Pseudomonas sp. Ant30-3]|nr:hypothetical protein [Pseudomonas sp. Ant30-3]
MGPKTNVGLPRACELHDADADGDDRQQSADCVEKVDPARLPMH